MYWINIAEPARIHSAWMNGFGSNILVSGRMDEPVSLVIDYHMSNRLYWTDIKQGFIESVNSDGRDRVVIARGGGIFLN